MGRLLEELGRRVTRDGKISGKNPYIEKDTDGSEYCGLRLIFSSVLTPHFLFQSLSLKFVISLFLFGTRLLSNDGCMEGSQDSA